MHEVTQWKCFVLDTPYFCDNIWYSVELFIETEHKMALVIVKCMLYIYQTWMQIPHSQQASTSGCMHSPPPGPETYTPPHPLNGQPAGGTHLHPCYFQSITF